MDLGKTGLILEEHLPQLLELDFLFTFKFSITQCRKLRLVQELEEA